MNVDEFQHFLDKWMAETNTEDFMEIQAFANAKDSIVNTGRVTFSVLNMTAGIMAMAGYCWMCESS